MKLADPFVIVAAGFLAVVTIGPTLAAMYIAMFTELTAAASPLIRRVHRAGEWLIYTGLVIAGGILAGFGILVALRGGGR